MGNSDLMDVTVILVHETPKAWIVNHGEKENAALPKSQCELEPDRGGKTWTLTLPQWLAEKKGII